MADVGKVTQIVKAFVSDCVSLRYASIRKLLAPGAMWQIEDADAPVEAVFLCNEEQLNITFTIWGESYSTAFLDENVAYVSGTLDATDDGEGADVRLFVAVTLQKYENKWLIECIYGPFHIAQHYFPLADERADGIAFDRLHHRDALTGTLGTEGMVHAVGKIQETVAKTPYAFVSLAVDNLSVINQMFGYHFGDELLRGIAVKLRYFCGKTEVCGHIFGSHFALFVEYTNRSGFEERLRYIWQRLVPQKLADTIRIPVIFSAGIYLAKLGEAEPMKEMLYRANLALKSIPERGVSHQFNYFDQKLYEEQQYKATILAMAPAAITENEFRLYIQPKVDLKTRTVVAGEALVRWMPSNGLKVTPDRFIPYFEQTGLITELDFYMLDLLCSTIRNWLDRGLLPLPISINQSRYHLKDSEYLSRFCRVVDRCAIPHSYLSVELTESMFAEENEVMRQLTQNLHQLGFLMEIDDFGVGYASLNFASIVPADVLKVDRSLLQDIQNSNSRGYKVLKKIIELAHELNMVVTCEGVETEQQLDTLEDILCDIVQGFYFYRPMPAEEFAQHFLIDAPSVRAEYAARAAE